MTLACWDRSRGHHGPCCMACIIEETDRRAGAEVDGAVRETQIVTVGGCPVAQVRACCFHWLWHEETVATWTDRAAG